MSKVQTERIRKMESYLDEAAEAIAELKEALARYERIQNKYYKLEEYYGSKKWMDDFEADEEGKLPADLKRGVLSEDALYDLLSDRDEVIRKMESFLKEEKETDGDAQSETE